MRENAGHMITALDFIVRLRSIMILCFYVLLVFECY